MNNASTVNDLTVGLYYHRKPIHYFAHGQLKTSSHRSDCDIRNEAERMRNAGTLPGLPRNYEQNFEVKVVIWRWPGNVEYIVPINRLNLKRTQDRIWLGRHD